MDKLPADFAAQFERDGYYIVKDFLSPDVLDAVKCGAGKLVDDLVKKLASEGKLNETFQDEPLEKRLLKINEATGGDVVPLLYRAELHRYPEFFRLFGNPDLLDVVQHALLPDAERIRIFPNYSMRPKLPSYSPHEVVWHQDAGLTGDGKPNTAPVQDRIEAFKEDKTVNCWTPLVSVTKENGAMKFLPSSHKLGIQKHVLLRQYRDKDEEFSYGRYATQIDPEILDKYEADSKSVDIVCGPGDIVFFSNILFHRGGHNNSDHVRWSLDWRYQDASCSTFRDESGHVLRSKEQADPDVVRDAETWTKLALT